MGLFASWKGVVCNVPGGLRIFYGSFLLRIPCLQYMPWYQWQEGYLVEVVFFFLAWQVSQGLWEALIVKAVAAIWQERSSSKVTLKTRLKWLLLRLYIMRPCCAWRRHAESCGSDCNLAHVLLSVLPSVAVMSCSGAPCHLVQTQVGVSDIHPFTDPSSVPLRKVAGCTHPGWTPCAIVLISACPSLLCRCFSHMSTFSKKVPSVSLWFFALSIGIPLRKTDLSFLFCSALFFLIMIFYNSLTIHCANKYSRSITWHILKGQYVMRSSCAAFHASFRTVHSALVQNQVLTDFSHATCSTRKFVTQKK